MPKYISPYEVLSCDKDKSYYMLTLLDKLLKHWIHPTFHAELLRPAVPNDDVHFPSREATFFYDFGGNPEREWSVNSIVNHNSIQFNVLWETGKVMQEPLKNCQELAALDCYLELHGHTHWCELPKK